MDREAWRAMVHSVTKSRTQLKQLAPLHSIHTTPRTYITVYNPPVHPKGDQSWVFTGRTDVEAETAILSPPDAKN